MSWLGTRILDLFVRRADGAVATAERDDAELPQKRGHAGAALMLLVPDAAGRSYFRSYTFEDAEAAAGFIDFWYPADSQPPLAAFWALHGRPEGTPDAEVVVIIRDPGASRTVHVFSFLDLELAHSFIRVSAAEGTDLGLFQLYWAVPVKVTIDKWRTVTIVPLEPPPVAREASLTFEAPPSAGGVPPAEVSPPWQPPDERVAPLEFASRSQDAEDERQWVPPATPRQATVTDNGRSAAPTARPEAANEESVSAKPAEAPHGVTSKGTVSGDNGLNPATPARAAAESTPQAEAPPEAVVAQPETAEVQETGPEKAATTQPPAADQEDAGNRHPEAAGAANAAGELEGLLKDLSKAMRVKRWESKEGPFHGFGSPPGKF